MKYIAVTYVDRKTGIPGFEAPMKNGPRHPDVKGLNIEWWDQSRWPIEHPDDYPKFYGTCDDDADIFQRGVVHVFQDRDDATAKEQYDNLWNMELKARLPSVATPRQLRLALLDAGLLDSVQTAIETLEEPIKSKALIEWEYASQIEKSSPLIQKLYPQLGLTEDQLDDLFEAAVSTRPTNPDENNTDQEES